FYSQVLKNKSDAKRHRTYFLNLMAMTAVGSFFPEYNLDADKHAIWDQDITDSEQCSSCSISLFCGGGCAYANLMRNGAINKPYCNDSHQTISTYIKKNETAFLELIK
ncbi:SPASM domain-containing protein, partial [Bacillus paranthracis]|uniref:SPASM domain-containing protein n=1 Tax=Bacillus paranthracis TaxID=2026186 RepID=UPI003D65FCB4